MGLPHAGAVDAASPAPAPDVAPALTDLVDPAVRETMPLPKRPRRHGKDDTGPFPLSPWVVTAVMMYVAGYTSYDIGKAVKRSPASVRKRFMEPKVKALLTRIQNQAEERAIQLMTRRIVDPVQKMQHAAPEMAEIMLQAARDETKCLPKALIAEKNLGIAGIVAAKRIEIRDDRITQMSVDELKRLADTGELPARFRSQLPAIELQAIATKTEDGNATQAGDEQQGV